MRILQGSGDFSLAAEGTSALAQLFIKCSSQAFMHARDVLGTDLDARLERALVLHYGCFW